MKRVLLVSLGLCILPACQTDTSRIPEVPPYAVPEDAVTEIDAVIPPVTDDAESEQEAGDLWQHVRSGFQMDMPEEAGARAEVKKQIRFFSKNQRNVESSLNRATPYLYLVVQELEKRELPMELALLPIIESAYNPKAKGARGAGGLWQFMPGTAKVLGLKKNAYYDAKHDVFASTQAALDYLDTLNKTFDGDWYQTLAAYNAGAGTVQRAKDSNRARGKGTEYWDLKLAQHTKEYVPKLLALAEMLKDPERYGLDFDTVANEPVMQKVDLDKPIALSEAAELAKVSLEDMVSLNPGFAKPWAVSGGPGYLMLPAEKADAFEEKLAHLPAARLPEHVSYTVKPGDTLKAIAKQYHVSPESLRQANHIYGTREPKRGRELKIPLSNKPSFDDDGAETRLADGARSHTIKNGDTLWKLSRQYKISMSTLAEANGLQGKASLKPGKTLHIPEPVETPRRVARTETPPMPAATTASTEGKQAISYTVQKGDSLARIAQKHKVAVKDLMRWNKAVTPKSLKPGQSLMLYVDNTRPAVAAKS